MKKRVVITGLGVTTHVGEGVEANWAALQRGPTKSVRNPSTSGLDRARQLARQATAEALTDAGLKPGALDPFRLGCTVSASKPLFNGDVPEPPELLNDFLRREFNFQGESRNVIAACATGLYSAAMAASWIEHDLCDVVITGSVEPFPHELIQAGFRQMGVTSPDGVTRPFDRDRAGFGFGEGAGIVVLESEAYARARGADIHAVLSGRALGADGYSAFAFNSQGGKIASVIDLALRSAGLAPQAIDHVNAHGTGTRHNDWIETQALLKAFGNHSKRLMISATKATTGHLLGASGAVELVFTILALSRQFVPPTATLRNPDPDCSLDYTAGQGHSADFHHALTLSLGFGGPIGAAVVSRS